MVLLTRNLDVSVGSIMGFAAYLTADHAAHHPAGGVEIVLIALALGGLLGLINGLIVAYAEVSPLIATLGTMSLYRGFTYIYANGRRSPPASCARWMLEAVDARIAGLSSLVVVAIVGGRPAGAVPALRPAGTAHLRGQLQPAGEPVLRPPDRAWWCCSPISWPA